MLPLISLQPIITCYLGAAFDVGRATLPTAVSSGTAVPVRSPPPAPTPVIRAFLLSSLYTAYTHCGPGAVVLRMFVAAPCQFQFTVYSKATSLGVFLRGKGLLPKLTLPHTW